ncbi:aminotransferase class V-fold PLP-dependent enzyme [Actinokineospora sp. NBRC 105648]|uniref:aminotransferase class V-fold PLP-dependent enzyme n=1 Tax=Actinokineospora sp. NBRC 105648 TaxID=3032206 RepID=UPI0024A4F8FC|nr:aminotransferase class V-fold PLP-dependent enzyme [Actinokineospora sp. NBRC 105648]GLZ37329.1 aminotransferase class V [Actinokineospora sp. NBRC 105648]
MRSHDHRFALDPTTLHLNPGAYGVLPRAVQAARAEYQRRAEANPLRFNRVDTPVLVERAREAAAAFLGTDGVALVRNVSEAVATVLASLNLTPDDEILLSDHGYGAVALACGARAKIRTVRFPITATPTEIVTAFTDGLRPNTKLVVVDSITSPTALVLPVRRIIEACHAAGAPVFVDAAHGPGHIQELPEETGADFWAGNFHKWAYAPRPCAALYLAPRWRDRIEPLVPSWEHPARFPRWFDHAGTGDYSAWMALPEALTWWRTAGGWTAVANSAEILDKGVRLVADALDTQGQVTDHHAPLMRLVPLPDGLVANEIDARTYYHELSTRHRAEVAVVWWNGNAYVRLGGTLPNTEDDYRALATILAEGR